MLCTMFESGPSDDLCFHLQIISFLKMQSRKNLLTEVPKSETRFQALLPISGGPGPLLFSASTAAPFESKSSAASTRPLHAARWSGVSPQADGPGRENCGNAELHRFNRQTNDECFWIQRLQNCSRQKNNHKQSQTHSTSFNTSCFRQITFNETMSINIVYFIPLVDTLGCFT